MPRGQGLQQQSHPKAEEHPQAYQPATQPRAPLPPPYYSTRHTEARNSVKVEWQKKSETERRGRGEDPKEICPEMHALAKMAEMAINRQVR